MQNERVKEQIIEYITGLANGETGVQYDIFFALLPDNYIKRVAKTCSINILAYYALSAYRSLPLTANDFKFDADIQNAANAISEDAKLKAALSDIERAHINTIALALGDIGFSVIPVAKSGGQA